MNQKTAKLLKKWAGHESDKPRDTRRWWLRLTRSQRAVERAKIRQELE